MGRPTGFEPRSSRDEYRRILIQVERAADVLESDGITPRQAAAVIQLLRSQIGAQRLLMDTLDNLEPEPADLDFDTDLRIMLDADNQENTN